MPKKAQAQAAAVALCVRSALVAAILTVVVVAALIASQPAPVL